MSNRSAPEISSNSKKEEFTRITFKPDLAKFNMTAIDDDLEALLKKRVYDLAGTVPGVKVYLNGQRIPVKSFRQYVDMYLANQKTPSGTPLPVIHEIISDRWEVAFTLSDGQFQQVSFVNSICTMKGGTHVNYISDQIVTKLIDAVKKKNKAAPLKPFQVKNHMWMFVNCLIENPTFDSQTKENMTLRSSAFGSKAGPTEDFIKKVLKSGVVENILSYAKFKQDQMLKKTDGAKKSRISGIVKLDDANNAGTRHAQNCTLILTEGDSAKALAVSGLSVVGRDNFGVFPLRGKLLNVREASHTQIMQNQEIQHIKQILGLQHGKVYTDTSSLRYGHLMIMTDQDHDGSHIKGLIINFLDHFWPSLLKIPGFLLEFITPIVKVTKGKGRDKQEVTFFTLPEYEAWKEVNDDGKNWTIKYYKGLGTSTSEDAKKYFSAMNRHLKPFAEAHDEDRLLVDMAFNKKKADDRKEWLRQFRPGTYMDHDVQEIPISDFINKELILFSIADNARSIPSVVDGFKPGHRKIVYCAFKRNLKNEIKVAQLAGYVSEHSAYHHGEQSLCSTIVGLAQNFVGSNNIHLLEPIGQFGTRLQGGKDAASARYIFTSLSPIARKIFHPADDALLKYLNDDGMKIEPEWYMPILPMVLVNGSEGIGTGWSSYIPNYNPRDIVDNLKRLMRGEEVVKMAPWYLGFKGETEQVSDDKFKVTGIVRKISDTQLEIIELPLRTWTQSYKEQLEAWLQGTDKQPACIKDYKEYHTDTTVNFLITLSEDQMAKAEAEGLDKRFKLSTTLTTSNMVCFDAQGRLRKYNNVEEILTEFYDMRLEFYQKRKTFLADQLTEEWSRLDNKVRFVLEIIQGKLVIQNRRKSDILTELRTRGYKPIYKNKSSSSSSPGAADDENTEEETGGKDHGYDYLLSMSLWSLTMEKVQGLIREKDERQRELDELLSKTPKDLWMTDLEEFEYQWDVMERTVEEEQASRPVKGKGKKAIIKKAAPKKKASYSGDDDDDMNDFDDDMEEDDEYDDYAPSKNKKATAASKKTDVTSVLTNILKPQVEKPKRVVSSSSSSTTLAAKKPAATATAPARAAPSSTSNNASSRVSPVTTAAASDSEEENSFSARLQKIMAARKPSPEYGTAQPPAVKEITTSLSTLSIDKPAPVNRASTLMSPTKSSLAKKKAPVKSKAKVIDDFDFPESSPVKPVVTKKPTAAASKAKTTVTKKPAAAAKKSSKKLFDSDEEEDDVTLHDVDSPIASPVVSKARIPRRAATTVKKTYAIVESDEDDVSDFGDEDDSFAMESDY